MLGFPIVESLFSIESLKSAYKFSVLKASFVLMYQFYSYFKKQGSIIEQLTNFGLKLQTRRRLLFHLNGIREALHFVSSFCLYMFYSSIAFVNIVIQN